MAELALQAGWPLMAWQRSVLNTALELRADGLPAYRTVVVTVPRQNGKTTLLWSLMLWWGLCHTKHVILATAQSGIEAHAQAIGDFGLRAGGRTHCGQFGSTHRHTEQAHGQSVNLLGIAHGRHRSFKGYERGDGHIEVG